MIQTGERFYTSLGLAGAARHLLGTLAAHAPARSRRGLPCLGLGHRQPDDLRIKMCIQINADDFVTIHHELGHNYYQRAYKKQPFLFRERRA